ncbi:MAG: hypothetical protein K0Q79_2424 [Flavipsychrobacter sp.]|jgi:hypothetical protein|nr:hypothetical protein [Flavipsychrobacter sp.]
MEHYPVTYNKTINLVLAMILPCFLIIPAIYFMAKYLPNLSDWAVGTIITVLVVLILVFTLKLTFSMVSKGTLIINDDGFAVDFAERKRFTPESFEVKIADITQFKPHIRNGNFYMSFTTSTPPFTFNIGCIKNYEEDMVAFLKLMQAVTQKVEEATGQKVKYS